MLSTPEFWVSVGFVLFVIGIYKPVSRGIAGALDTRAEKIKATLDEAAQLREEAQHLLAEYQRKQRDAVKETEEMLDRAREEAKHLAAEALENLERALVRREEMAREKIAQAEAEALRQVREVAIDVAVAATRRLIAENLDEGKANTLLEDAIAELPGKLH